MDTMYATFFSIQEATRMGQVERLDGLLKNQSPEADNNIVTDLSQIYSVSKLALEHGNVTCMTILLDFFKVDINMRDEKGTTLLIHAVVGNRVECMRELLKRGANPWLRNNYARDALSFAAQIGNFESLSLLLDQPGLDIDSNGVVGISTLLYATLSRRTECVSLLLDKKANPNFGSAAKYQGAQNVTALMISSGQGSTTCVRMLLDDPRTEVDMTDSLGRTALMYAAGRCSFDAVHALLDKESDASLRDKEGRTAVDYASKYPVIQRVLLRSLKPIPAYVLK